jgi:hypothetical protein
MNCNEFCTNIEEREISRKVGLINYPNILSYFCKITKGYCVGMQDSEYTLPFKDKLDVKTIERCPSRKRVEDLTEE